MKNIVFEKDKMLFFPTVNEGVIVAVPTKKHLVIKLCDYMSANGMEDVDFTWQGGGDKVTVWCHHHLGDLTNVYLVGLMSKECWLNCGWYEYSSNPMQINMGWNKETKVFDFVSEQEIQKVME